MGLSTRVVNTLRAPLTIGIRREDPKRIWERRAPLTPDAVYELVSKRDVRVLVEPCDRRVFPSHEYAKAGATVTQNLDSAHILVGIKETPLDQLITSPIANPRPKSDTPLVPRTHLMFSHTAKGQPYNTPLLARFLASPSTSLDAAPLLPTLVDYELLTHEKDGKRTVGFGWHAGVAGVLESLSSMAQAHLGLGIASPFLFTPRPYTLPSLDRLRAAFRDIGKQIASEGTPPALGPFVIGLTGNGNVAQGCLSMLEELPIQRVRVQDLHGLVTNKDTDLRKIYLVHAQPEDYFVGTDGRKYDRSDYYKTPQKYRSTFAENIAPYLTLFLNGTGWAPGFPRLMSNEDLTVALQRAPEFGGARFTNIGDISCDIEGGLEFMDRATTLSTPFYTAHPDTLPAHLPSVQVMSVDILPASIPLDASKHFSKALKPYLNSLIDSYTVGSSTGEASRAIDRATIARHGKLLEKHQWLQPAVDKFYGISTQQATLAPSPTESPAKTSGAPPKKRILMLGSGMVAGPAVEEIASRSDLELLIASNSASEIQKLVSTYPNVQHRIVDMSDQSTYAHLIEASDVVISLLPVAFHTTAAELCIKHRKHLVTASYISEGMRALHDQAVAADVLLLNEIGLDPGIDHCSAISLINRLHAEGKKIVSFTSFCGGLPAPDVPVVPLRYKFSWSPRGVLTAALNSARYRLNNQMVEIPGRSLLRSHFPSLPITKEFDLEGIANRDSLPYAESYNLGSNIRTLLRGTLRYPGFSNLMHCFRAIGLLETDQKIVLDRWGSLINQCLSLHLPQGVPAISTLSVLNSLIPPSQAEALHQALEWLSLLPASTIGFVPSPMPPVPAGPQAPLDLFAYLLAYKLRYLPNERDMVILSHEIIAKRNEPLAPEEVHTSSLITYGTPTASAMARTVGLPVAIAALNVVDGKVDVRGVQGPSHPSIYNPVLEGLEAVGLGMKETASVRQDTAERKLTSYHAANATNDILSDSSKEGPALNA
ncbi:hypothetical protein AX16_007454 [Volvariella volvacea WC 439]|nr:hypothetical protein AX16_007454 [Volvariella volvacea WC 439]